MAELVLKRVGAALGRLAPEGIARDIAAQLGREAGRRAGRYLDDALLRAPRRIEEPRLEELRVQTSLEGASLPIVFGRARVSGQIIWAARFREIAAEERVGEGKNAPTRRYFRYSLSFAVGLCEGPNARVERVWANGDPLDLSRYAHRVYSGAEHQPVDPLIEAIEGAANAPAFRGLCYVVFEDLPLDAFGDAVPQLSFEVVRPRAPAPGALEEAARAVCVIPGSGEFAYATTPVRRTLGPGRDASENAHAQSQRANALLALDQLESDLPNVRAASLVVSWFGDDLRCGQCRVEPRVENAEKITKPVAWTCGPLTRATARLVSQSGGGPAFGGTPGDASVLEMIAELKRRGMRVTLNPFLLMDIPAGAALPDPYGGAAQAAYPWRGRITGDVGADKSAAARAQVAAFFGAAQPGDFALNGSAVAYSGAAEFRYRRFILHYAYLARAAGGVDAFIIGSELRGLTTLRDDANLFPAVEQLRALAADVRAVLGPGVDILYAADWSEYFGHQPADGSGDVFFHLDPLWADPNIAAIAIDWYAPLTDWREGEAHLDRADARSAYDGAYLRARIEGGEGYDWFYASESARAAQARTPITDGAYGKPWVFRPKDLRRFWSEPHYDRPGGVEAAAPTAWAPRSKPIRLMELGVPAIDKGANAPNLFLDPKSAESAAPPFSSGARDDLAQRSALEAYLAYWSDPANNPHSDIYDGPMIDTVQTHLWAWDARPYPHFPARADVWSDGQAWARGHWLNGRAGAPQADGIAAELAGRVGASIAAAPTLAPVAGYVVDTPSTAAAALAPLIETYALTLAERAAGLTLIGPDESEALALDPDDLAEAVQTEADEPGRRPTLARVRFIDADRDYRVGAIVVRDASDAAMAGDSLDLDAPILLSEPQAAAIGRDALARVQAGAQRARLTVSPARVDAEAGDLVSLAAIGGPGGLYRVESAEEGAAPTLRLAKATVLAPPRAGAPIGIAQPPPPQSTPLLVFLDLPPLPGAERDERPLAGVFADPWPGPIEIYAGADPASATARGRAGLPARIGRLEWALWPGPIGRWDDGNVVRIVIPGAALSEIEPLAALAGAQTFAVESGAGGWEIVTARSARLVGPDTYELSGLLRGLQGTEASYAPAGALAVLLDARLARLDLAPHERGAPLTLLAPPPGLGPLAPDAARLDVTYRGVWARPFSPARLRAERAANGDLLLSWIRRARIDGDAWEGEPPLSEEMEMYEVEIRHAGAVKRVWRISAPPVLYTISEQILDFGGPAPTGADFATAQLSARFGRGRDSVAPL